MVLPAMRLLIALLIALTACAAPAADAPGAVASPRPCRVRCQRCRRAAGRRRRVAAAVCCPDDWDDHARRPARRRLVSPALRADAARAGQAGDLPAASAQRRCRLPERRAGRLDRRVRPHRSRRRAGAAHRSSRATARGQQHAAHPAVVAARPVGGDRPGEHRRTAGVRSRSWSASASCSVTLSQMAARVLGHGRPVHAGAVAAPAPRRGLRLLRRGGADACGLPQSPPCGSAAGG